MNQTPAQAAAPQYDVAHRKLLIQRRFLGSISYVMVALATVGLFFSLMRIPQTGLHFSHLVHVVLALVVLVMHFLRKRLRERQFVYYILGVFAALGLSSFVQYGIVSAGFYFTTISIFVAGVTLGWWYGLLCALLYTLATAFIGYLWMSGFIMFPGNVAEYILQPWVWVTLGGSYLITSAVFYVSASGFVANLGELVDTVDRQNEEIQTRTAELSLANQRLEEAISQIRTLDGLLPICSNCKKIRDDKGYWQQVEQYVQHHTQAEFTHGLCPDCMSKLYPEIADKVIRRMEKEKD